MPPTTSITHQPTLGGQLNRGAVPRRAVPMGDWRTWHTPWNGGGAAGCRKGHLAAPCRRPRWLTDLRREAEGEGVVALGVHLGHVGAGVTQEHLGGLQPELLARPGRHRVAELVRVPRGNARLLAGPPDGVLIGAGVVRLLRHPL